MLHKNAALGVGVGATGFLAGTAGFLKVLLPYRPVFIGLSILLMGLSFYLAYRKPTSVVCVSGDVCTQGTGSGVNRTWLWIAAGFALALILAL